MQFSRYDNLIFDGKMVDMPKIIIDKRNTDKSIAWDPARMRVDRLSGSLYGADGYGFLIMLANPEYSMEFDIPKGTILRIPFPFKEVRDEFVKKILDLKNK